MADAVVKAIAWGGLAVIGLLAAYAFVFIFGFGIFDAARSWRNRTNPPSEWTLRQVGRGLVQVAIFGVVLLIVLLIVVTVADDFGLV